MGRAPVRLGRFVLSCPCGKSCVWAPGIWVRPRPLPRRPSQTLALAAAIAASLLRSGVPRPGHSCVCAPLHGANSRYNEGLFLLRYWGEINESARSILEGRPVCKGTLEQGWQVTRLLEAFAGGPGKAISLEEEQ